MCALILTSAKNTNNFFFNPLYHKGEKPGICQSMKSSFREVRTLYYSLSWPDIQAIIKFGYSVLIPVCMFA